MSWCARPDPAASTRSVDVLCFIVLRRHGRRFVRRIDRSLRVLMGGRIPDPCRAGSALPPPLSGHMEAVQSLALAAVAVAMAAVRQLVLARGRRSSHLS